MVVMFTVVPPPLAAALLPPAAGAVVVGVLDDELAELAHADSARATAASPAAPSIFRIRILLFTVLVVSHGDHVPGGRSVHVRFSWPASGFSWRASWPAARRPAGRARAGARRTGCTRRSGAAAATARRRPALGGLPGSRRRPGRVGHPGTGLRWTRPGPRPAARSRCLRSRARASPGRWP